MAQLIFVHGVANRSDKPGFDAAVANRDSLFRSIAFDGQECHISNPMWGDDAQRWAWDEASLPTQADREKIESFSLTGGLTAPTAAGATGGDFARMAATDSTAAIDTLFAAMVEKANNAGNKLDAQQIADFRKATSFFEALPEESEAPPICVADDDRAVVAVRKLVETEGAYGLMDYLRNAASAITGEIRNTASTGLVDLFRDQLNPAVARFLGDIFVYLKPGEQRAKIRADIEKALLAGWEAAQNKGGPLVLIGHSLGGVILYDMLSSPEKSGLPTGFKANVLVTVGSQVGVFEEFKLYDASNNAYSAEAKNKVPALKTVSAWMNVFDPVDLLSFRCEPIFEGVDDYVFSSATGLASAHTAYFCRPRFFARLRARLGGPTD